MGVYVYAKRTDTDCFVVIEDEQGNKQYARTALLYPLSGDETRPVMIVSAPLLKEDGTEFRAAAVYVLADRASIVMGCDENGQQVS